MSRRTTLGLGALGLLGAGAAGTGIVRELTGDTLRPATAEAFREPDVLRSSNGVLDARLRAAEGTHRVAGRRARTLGFNEGVPGPTLVVRPGETLRIRLDNALPEPTNLHVHGLHVTPEGRGDDVFTHVAPGASRQYEYQLPEDHPTGLYWYHPHSHGTVAEQVFGGLYGAILVLEADDGADLGTDRERLMVVSDVTLDSDGRLVEPSRRERMQGREGELVLLNGQSRPAIRARAGDRERWRVVNACSSRYLALDLAGQDARVIGRDLGRLVTAVPLTDVVLAPGNRLDMLVDLRRGSGELVARPVDRGAVHDMGDMGDMGMGGGMTSGGTPSGDGDAVTLATLSVAEGASARRGSPPPVPELRDLRREAVTARRSLRFEEDMSAMMGGGAGFTFGGEAFDPDRIDQRVSLDTVEEWVIGNDTEMDHPFHLHVWPMQVLEAEGERTDEPLWLDVVNVPARGRVVVRVPFEDFGGRSVYHCHILDHEDRGMMGTVQVV